MVITPTINGNRKLTWLSIAAFDCFKHFEKHFTSKFMWLWKKNIVCPLNNLNLRKIYCQIYYVSQIVYSNVTDCSSCKDKTAQDFSKVHFKRLIAF